MKLFPRLVFVVVIVFAAASIQAADATIQVRIQNTQGLIPGDTAEIHVVMESIEPIGGLDFLIRYNDSVFSFVDVYQDTGLSNWEYFVHSHNSSLNTVGIYSIADIVNGPYHPLPEDFYANGSAVVMRFVADENWSDSSLAYFSFYWGDCGDNAASSATGCTLLVVNKVFDAAGNLIWDETDDVHYPEEHRIPNLGVPDSCTQGGGDGIQFKVNFQFGVVTNYSICGDVDANLIVDVSDVVYLISYIFFDGPPPIPLESGDVDCSDVVEISDAVYLVDYIFSGGPAPCAGCP